MKLLFTILCILIFAGIYSNAFSQYNLNEYRLVFKGQEIKQSQMDSISKIYPKLDLTFDKNTNPPTLYIEPAKDSIAKKNTRDSIAMFWINKSLPAINKSDINGKYFTMDQLKGKVVVLNFYFTSCAPCIKEMPELNKLVAMYEKRGVIFLAFALQNKEEVRGFLKKHPFLYKQVADAEKLTKETFKINMWPTHIITDKNGIIQYFSQGYSKNTILELKEKIEALQK